MDKLKQRRLDDDHIVGTKLLSLIQQLIQFQTGGLYFVPP